MKFENIDVKQFLELINDNKELEIIDVREKDEYEEAHIKDSKLISLGSVLERQDEIDWSKDILFVCRSGMRSARAASVIEKNTEKRIMNLEGGILACLSSEECRKYLEMN